MHTWFHVQLDQKIFDGLYSGHIVSNKFMAMAYQALYLWNF